LARFIVKATVDQSVTRYVKLELDAFDEEDAMFKATEALKEFPRAVQTNSIHRMISTKDEYTVPSSVEFTEVREELKFA
jgi:hypothetical protein